MADQPDPAATPAATPTPNGLDAEVLIKQARSYLAFGEQLAQFANPLTTGDPNGSDWGAVLRQHFDQFKAAVGQPSGTAAEPSPELARLSTLPLEMWQQTAASLGVSAAALGQGTPVWESYQRVQADYLALLRQAASEALDLMEQQLNERAGGGQMIHSVRELYNLWVDCNEKTYGQLIRSHDYAELNGHLFNMLLQCYARGETAP